ncbi:MAG: hypothetical protein ACYC5Q_10830 [Thermoleophilia bacterium]
MTLDLIADRQNVKRASPPVLFADDQGTDDHLEHPGSSQPFAFEPKSTMPPRR